MRPASPSCYTQVVLLRVMQCLQSFLRPRSEGAHPPAPARHLGGRPSSLGNARMGRKWPLFACSISSPDSQTDDLGVPNPESLRSLSRKFPFCGDYRQRLGAIKTAASTSMRHRSERAVTAQSEKPLSPNERKPRRKTRVGPISPAVSEASRSGRSARRKMAMSVISNTNRMGRVIHPTFR